METTNRYYDIYTEGNVPVTVRVKARNNRQNTSLAESASQTTAPFSKNTVQWKLLFICIIQFLSVIQTSDHVAETVVLHAPNKCE